MNKTNKNIIIQEYFGTSFSGNQFFISNNGNISKNSVKNSYKSIKEVIKVLKRLHRIKPSV